MEKTLESLQRALSGGSTQRRLFLPMIGSRKRFGDFVERVRVASSKHFKSAEHFINAVQYLDVVGILKQVTVFAERGREEDEIVKSKLDFLQDHLSQPNIILDDVEESLLYAMYCETLGYNCSFSYIHSLKLAQQGNLHQKLIGYVAATIFLNKNHELVILLINTIQKDLKSSNVAEICMALITVCHLINSEMVPSVQILIEEKLNHPHPIVRKFAVLALQHCLNQLQNWHISSTAIPKLENALTDGDLSVVTAAISTLKQLIKIEPTKFIHLISSLVQIQDQLIHRKLRLEFEYHNIPSPWLQIQILQILAVLGKYDPQKSVKIYPMVKETLQRAEVNQNISYAIIFECIQTIINIHHGNEELLQLALTSVAKLLKSKRANLKYMGIKALALVSKNVHPHFANEHQEIVMECLHHSDVSMRIQTLDLLYAMANPSNVQIICEKMTEYLKVSSDYISHKSIVNKISELAFQFHPDTSWLITTVNSLLFVAGEDVPRKTIYDLMEKIKNGSDQLKVTAFEIYTEFCDNSNLPSQIIYLTSWVLGEMWCYCMTQSSRKTQENLCKLLSKNLISSEETQLWILSAILKVILNSGIISEQVKPLIEECKENKYQLVQQKAHEILRVIENIENILPLFAQIKNEKIDPTLSFLDGFVCQALESGADPYKPQNIHNLFYAPIKSETELLHSEETFQFPLESSDSKSDTQSIVCSPSYHSLGSENFLTQDSPHRSDNVKMKNIWTKEGRLKDKNVESFPSSSQLNCNKENSQSSAKHQELCKALFAGISDINTASQKKEDVKLISKEPSNVIGVSEIFDKIPNVLHCSETKIIETEHSTSATEVLQKAKIDNSLKLSVQNDDVSIQDGTSAKS